MEPGLLASVPAAAIAAHDRMAHAAAIAGALGALEYRWFSLV